MYQSPEVHSGPCQESKTIYKIQICTLYQNIESMLVLMMEFGINGHFFMFLPFRLKTGRSDRLRIRALPISIKRGICLGMCITVHACMYLVHGVIKQGFFLGD